jgi:hypothetical protein
MVLGKLETHRRLELDSCVSRYAKWIKDLNIRAENLKLLEENTSGYKYRQRISK